MQVKRILYLTVVLCALWSSNYPSFWQETFFYYVYIFTETNHFYFRMPRLVHFNCSEVEWHFFLTFPLRHQINTDQWFYSRYLVSNMGRASDCFLQFSHYVSPGCSQSRVTLIGGTDLRLCVTMASDMCRRRERWHLDLPCPTAVLHNTHACEQRYSRAKWLYVFLFKVLHGTLSNIVLTWISAYI
jgi:hypothetical protein